MPNDDCLLQVYIQLTARQREVLRLVSEGLTNREVADQLYIAPCVVAGHLTKIYDTLATLEALSHTRPNRYVLISLYADFFRRHPLFNTHAQSPSAPRTGELRRGVRERHQSASHPLSI